MTTFTDLPVPPRPSTFISALADLFPKTFIAERWDPHRPLKIGIDADLIATGILTPREVGSALHHYVTRRMYLVATAAGGPRFDLNGKEAGEVTSQQADWARARLAHIDSRPARESRKVAEGRAWVEARKAIKEATGSRDAGAPVSPPPPAEKTHVRPSSGAHRHSLADLRAAALARRAAVVEARA
jgi:sRNA-binding protein